MEGVCPASAAGRRSPGTFRPASRYRSTVGSGVWGGVVSTERLSAILCLLGCKLTHIMKTMFS